MAVATFVLAVLGAVLSTASLAWQFANYYLSGPRISVELSRSARLGSTSLVVTVRNRGRLPLTLVNVGLSFEPEDNGPSLVRAISEREMVRIEPYGVHEVEIDPLPGAGRSCRGFAELATGKSVSTSPMAAWPGGAS